MKLQNIIFPSLETCQVEEMYFRYDGEVEIKNDSIIMNQNAILTCDTYFNGFSLSKWKKYTRIKDIFLTISFIGGIKIRLMKSIMQNNKTEVLQLKEKKMWTQGGKMTLRFPDSRSGGIVYFEIEALEKTVFFGGFYGTDIGEEQISDTRIALDICTFKREEFVKKNIGMINTGILASEKYDDLRNCLEIFVIDNAGTLDVEKFSQPHVRIFKNKNVGGSGGFTRGMIEIKKVADQEKITHVILMDDDIVIEPEVLFRTWTVLSIMKSEYADAFIGGAMLRLDKPNIQVESAALWNGGDLISRKKGLDLSKEESCLLNEVEEPVDYTAWWYTVIPMKIVRWDNLPLPFFIRGDDVEYGLRNARTIITMNGICVWHEPFENKYSSSLYYYILRNQLIENAIHDQTMGKKDFIYYIYCRVMEEVYFYRYKNAWLYMEAVSDFLKGVDWLKKQDGEQRNLEIIEMGYKLLPIKANETMLDMESYERAVKQPQKFSIAHRIIRKLTLNGILIPGKYKWITVPLNECKLINTYRAENVIHYDKTSGKGFITKRDPEEALKCKKAVKRLQRRIDNCYDQINEEFRTRCGELESIDFWKKYLEIE